MSKTAVGTQALKWWAEYVQTGNTDLLMDIARYCCFDEEGLTPEQLTAAYYEMLRTANIELLVLGCTAEQTAARCV